MPDYRFTTIGPSEAAANNQWDAFVADPFGDASVSWVVNNGLGVITGAPGVSIVRFLDDDGARRWDVRLSGVRENDNIAEQFQTNGVSGLRLTQHGGFSANLHTRQWRNILLITGEVLETDPWPNGLREHVWLGDE